MGRVAITFLGDRGLELMKKTMAEVSPSSDSRPEPHWIGTLLMMLYFLVLIVNAFRHDAALKKLSENDQQDILPP